MKIWIANITQGERFQLTVKQTVRHGHTIQAEPWEMFSKSWNGAADPTSLLESLELLGSALQELRLLCRGPFQLFEGAFVLLQLLTCFA